MFATILWIAMMTVTVLVIVFLATVISIDSEKGRWSRPHNGEPWQFAIFIASFVLVDGLQEYPWYGTALLLTIGYFGSRVIYMVILRAVELK